MKKVTKSILKVMLCFALVLVGTLTMQSNVKASEQIAATGLGQVTNLRQTDARTGSFTVSYNAVVGASRYDVAYSSDNITWVTDTTYSAYDTISGLSAGCDYYVRVRAYESSGRTYGAYSETIRVSTAPSDVENSSIVQTNATANSITISWTAISGATGYRIAYWPTTSNADNAQAVTSGTNSVTLSNLSKDTEYNVRVYSYRLSGAGYTAMYDSLWGYSNAKTLPTKIAGVTNDYFSTSTSGYATFEWDANDIADGYQYIIYNNKGKKILSGNTSSRYLSLTKSALKARSFYSIKVRGYINTANNSKKYGPYSATQYFAKLNTSDVRVSNSGGKIKASWKKVTGATNYTVYVSTKYNSGYKKVGTTKKTSLKTSRKIKTGTSYYVRVVANKKVGKTTYKATINSKSAYSAYGYRLSSGRFYTYSY